MTELLKPVPTCPCCGHTVNEMADLQWNAGARTLVGRGKAIVLSPLRGRMFDLLWKRFSSGRLTHKSAMMDALYSEHPDGGPDSDNVISVQVIHLRKQIEPFGLSVKGRAGYMLVIAKTQRLSA